MNPPGEHARARSVKSFNRTPKEPGAKGAGRRYFNTEECLAEATECPAGDLGQQVMRNEITYHARYFKADGTTCAGPSCPHWNAIITNRDEKTGEPIRAEVCCTLGGRTNAMGIIKRSKVKQ